MPDYALYTFAIFPVLLIGSCSHQLTPDSYAELPRSREFYTGSILYDTWVYRGTTERGNHLTYTWSRNNFLHDRDFLVDYNIEPPCEFPLTTDKSQWIALAPRVDNEGQLIGFARRSKNIDLYRNQFPTELY